MTVPRPHETNLGSKNEIFDFSKFAIVFWSKICFGRVEARFLQVEGVKREAGEARKGPRRAK